ncbi:hypothetical protein [Clostridium sp.]|jgi:hypothetical protein|uniref:hypothetical protein n=1 Tax=Clostridium sp. TaxID=1506 RepID=UPI003EEBE41A
MKIELRNKILILIAILVFSSSTIIFAALSIFHKNNLLYSILTQGSGSVTMLLMGILFFVYQKQKLMGIFLWLVSAFSLFVTISKIYSGI